MTAPLLYVDGAKNAVQSTGYGASQDVAVGATSAQSALLPATTRIIRLCATTNCRIRIGTNPTALATDTFLPANAVEYVRIPATDTTTQFRVAVIQVSAGGTLNITIAI